MTGRTLGTVLMILGFAAALAILIFCPNNRESCVIGFAVFGVGCMMGGRPKGRPRK